MSRYIALALPIVFWLAVAGVVLVSVTPQDRLPGVDMWDKLQHALSYGLLTVLGGLAYRHTGQFRWVVLGCVTLGIALELAQLFVPGRNGDVADAFANGIGAAAGLGLILALRRFWPVTS